MTFKKFAAKINTHIDQMLKGNAKPLTVNVDPNLLWYTYLASFPKGTNPIFRERTEHDCSCCKAFIRQFGNVVVINKDLVVTIWDVATGDEVYDTVSKKMAEFVRSHDITDRLVTTQQQYGQEINYEQTDERTIPWNHFHYTLDRRHIHSGRDTVDTEKNLHRTNAQLFQRALTDLTQDSVETVIELAQQGSLYKGDEWKAQLKSLLKYQKAYAKVIDAQKSVFIWSNYEEAGMGVSRIRNSAVGTLLVDISAGVDLEKAVKSYESKVAPHNYKRPKAISTKASRDKAKKLLDELGYTAALKRRFARLEDLSINDVLFANKDARSALKDSDDPFDLLEAKDTIDPKTFSRLEEIPIDRFIADVLPSAKSVEILLENRHTQNLVSVTAPVVPDALSMFKWKNGFSWAYTGNITDSSISENVASFGGNINAILRASIQWNEKGDNNDDLDLHATLPDGAHVYFGNKRKEHTNGSLDVDIRYPVDECSRTKGIAVENFYVKDKTDLQKGRYTIWVENYQSRGAESGFNAEIVMGEQTVQFSYPKPVTTRGRVTLGHVDWDGKTFTFVSSNNETLVTNNSGISVWGLDTNQFHPVKLAMYSPNHWDGETGVGNKHYMFMLNGAENDEQPSGFFNEFLDNALTPHRRTFESVSNVMRVEPDKEQLSGVGFSSTRRNDVIVKVEGKTTRMLKVKF